MKKKILVFISLLTIFQLTGCGKEKIDLDKVYSNLEDDFESFTKVDDSVLEGSYGIDLSYFDDYLVVMDEDGTSSKMYAVFVAKNSDAADEVTYFISQYIESWDNGYFPEETKRVKYGKKFSYGDYIIYVVSDNNDEIIEKIRKSN